MTQLILVRHATASSDDPSAQDIDRPLSSQGQDMAQAMAKRLRDKDLSIDKLISSPANRAITTARLMAEFLSYTKSQIIEDKRVYENTVDDLMNIIQEFDSATKTLMIVGHNPALSSLAAYLSNDSSIDLPPGGVICLKSDNEWHDFKFHCATIAWQETPKEA